MTDQAPELLPCPLCKAEGHTLFRGFRYKDGSSEKYETVMCPACDCHAPLKSWNTRPTPAERPVGVRIVAHEDCLNCRCGNHELCAGTEPRVESVITIDRNEAIAEALSRPVPQVREALEEAIAVLESWHDDETEVELLPRLRAALTARPSDAAVAWRWKVSPNQLNWVYSESPSPVPQFNVEPLYALPPDEPARVTPSTVGGEAQVTLETLLARPDHGPFYHVTQNEKDTCEICNRDYPKAASPTIASEKECGKAEHQPVAPFPPPKGGWVCFHCGERFWTVAEAAVHFGGRPNTEAACLIKHGNERDLARVLRETEQERDELFVRLNAVRLGLDKSLEDESVERYRANSAFQFAPPAASLIAKETP